LQLIIEIEVATGHIVTILLCHFASNILNVLVDECGLGVLLGVNSVLNDLRVHFANVFDPTECSRHILLFAHGLDTADEHVSVVGSDHEVIIIFGVETAGQLLVGLER
jgi:hypothetical protein